jgi:hypothetical protein
MVIFSLYIAGLVSWPRIYIFEYKIEARYIFTWRLSINIYIYMNNSLLLNYF